MMLAEKREMVGMKGFEPSTPAPPEQCATKLRYIPTDLQV